MRLVHNVVGAIADREDIDPTELKPPLHDVVDVEALESLVTSAKTQQDGPYPVVEFAYCGYTVTVDGAGDVTASKPTETTDGGPDTTAASSLGALSAALDHREDALRQVSDIIAARDRPFEDRLDGVLAVVRETLDLDAATLSYVDGSDYLFEAVDTTATVDIQAGTTVPLDATACQRVVENEQALVSRDLEVGAPGLSPDACEIASYIGVPVFVDGTFCFYDSETQDSAFSDWERAFVELLGEWVSSELERRQRTRAMQAETTDQPDTTC